MRKQYKIFVSRRPYAIGEEFKLTFKEKIYARGYMDDARRQGFMGLKNLDPEVPVFMTTPFSGRYDALAWFMPSQFKIGVYTGIARKLKHGRGYRVVWGRINEGLVMEIVDGLTKKLIGRFTDCHRLAADMGGTPMPDDATSFDITMTYAGVTKPDKEVRFDG